MPRSTDETVAWARALGHLTEAGLRQLTCLLGTERQLDRPVAGTRAVCNGTSTAAARTIPLVMLASRTWIRASFVLADSLIAAAVADFATESASNAGLFGSGAYTDHSTLATVPVVSAGLAFAFAWMIMLFRHIRVCALTLDMKTILRFLPAIFMTQLVALFVMESVEQLVVCGHFLGPAIWLGGPVAISLAVHAAMCVAVTILIAKSLHAFARTLAGLIHFIRRAIASFARGSAHVYTWQRLFTERHCEPPVLCRIGERAPPFVSP
ncbi:MAG: hypothetical protein ACXVAW_02810 [Vulcanimicrobiaceae bacterium]